MASIALIDRLPHRIDYRGVVGNDVLISLKFWQGNKRLGVPADITNMTITPYLQLEDGTAAPLNFTLALMDVNHVVLTLNELQTAALGAGTWIWTLDIDNNGLLFTQVGGEMRMYDREDSPQ